MDETLIKYHVMSRVIEKRPKYDPELEHIFIWAKNTTQIMGIGGPHRLIRVGHPNRLFIYSRHQRQK